MPTPRCDLEPQDCVADHLCHVLGARPQPGGGWRASCPAHDDHEPSLTLNVGTRGRRIVWHCHRGCPALAVRTAMISMGIRPGCLGPVRQPAEQPDPKNGDGDLRARLQELILSPPSMTRLRVEIGMALWGCDGRTAAEKLGVPRTTRHREGLGCARLPVHTSPPRSGQAPAGQPGVSDPP